MYAIRSYYVKIRHYLQLFDVDDKGGTIEKTGGLGDLTFQQFFDLTEIDVITSYSIHYTKLYESSLPSGGGYTWRCA